MYDITPIPGMTVSIDVNGGLYDKIDRLSKAKADKAYMVELFNELKSLILSGDTNAAVALLDQAILDNSILA